MFSSTSLVESSRFRGQAACLGSNSVTSSGRHPRSNFASIGRPLAAFVGTGLTTLALLLWRRRAILIFFLAGLEKFLKLTSKLWIQLFKSSKVLLCVGLPAHFCKEHPPILIGLGHTRFQLNSLTVMFKGLRIVLRPLLPKRESKVIMRLSKVRIITDRLFELNLRRGELLGTHEIDALVVNFESQTANLFLKCTVHIHATPPSSSAAETHCSDSPCTKYTTPD